MSETFTVASDSPDDSTEPTRCGFVALIGAPNAGKSTLLNAVVGSKVAIVTPKVQTTRSRIVGIAMQGRTQLIFVDTPGIFAPRRALDRAMVAAAWAGAHNADVVVHMVDAKQLERGLDEDTARIVQSLRDVGRKSILALNKVDVVSRPSLLKLADTLFAEGIYSDVFMIAALNGDGVGDLVTTLAGRLPLGPWLYPPDQIADMPLRLLAAEVTREKIFLQLSEEVPYSATVETESWTDRDDGSVRIEQVVYVQRPGQKAIVLGKGGQRIKSIGAAARLEVEKMLERRVHLFLFVKVRENWPDDPERFTAMGLDRVP